MSEGPNLAALPVEDLAALLQQAGSSGVTADRIRADLERGAPANPDGTVHLLAYTAWLTREVLDWRRARKKGPLSV